MSAKLLVSTIEEAVKKFLGTVSSEQRRLLDDIEALLARLNLTGNKIDQSVENLRIATEIKADLQRLINTGVYSSGVKDFVQTFKDVEFIQTNLFYQIKQNADPSEFTKALRNDAIKATVNSLTGAGMKEDIGSKLYSVLKNNIATGAKYSDMLKDVRSTLISDKTGQGILERYTKQVATDSLNQFSRSYLKSLSDDMGADWFMYTGPIIDGSRAWCRAMVQKKYFHRVEIFDLLHGDFAEFSEMDGKINPKTKLPEGMIPQTNEANLFANCGGYSCEHQITVTSSSSVPMDKKLFVQTKYGIAA